MRSLHNLRTEDDAKLLWCPFADGGQRLSSPFKQHPCIGPGCMAWRWASADEDAKAIAEDISDGDPTGYCGLAGEP